MRIGADKNWFLGHVKPNVYRTAVRPAIKTHTAPFAGSMNEYVTHVEQQLQKEQPNNINIHSKHIQEFLHNKVKKCTGCGKANAFTLMRCNKCQHDLSNTPLSLTSNVFAGFILGIAKTDTFPLYISLRHENDHVIVFDDPLALSPLHLNAIPTNVCVPDWRYLLLHPQHGLELSRMLQSSCHDVAQTQFFKDQEWCTSLLSPVTHTQPTRKDVFDLEHHMIMGYNYPPSQNQLHIHYMLPVLMPHQYMLYLQGIHFTHMRFFPTLFVDKVLARLIESDKCFAINDLNLSIDKFVEKIKDVTHIDYTKEHHTFYERVQVEHAQCANWNTSNFAGIYDVVEKSNNVKVLRFSAFDSESGTDEREVDTSVAYEKEKQALENYGKSYHHGASNSNSSNSNNANEYASLGYYSYHKSLADIDFTFVKEIGKAHH